MDEVAADPHEEAKPALPTSIEGTEVIVRAVKTPYHYDIKKQKFKHAAFRPSSGKIVSVARTLVGISECKRNFLAKAGAKGGEGYIGFGALFARSITSVGSDIVDAPDDYYGHAHIIHPEDAPQQSEPNFAELNLAYIPRLKELADKTQVYLDPSKDAKDWSGADPLTPPQGT